MAQSWLSRYPLEILRRLSNRQVHIFTNLRLEDSTILYKLDGSIASLYGFLVTSYLVLTEIYKFNTNIADPDQMTSSVACYLDFHFCAGPFLGHNWI